MTDPLDHTHTVVAVTGTETGRHITRITIKLTGYVPTEKSNWFVGRFMSFAHTRY